MLSAARRGFVNTRVSPVVYRSYARTSARAGGASHGDDDHAHHDHPMWETLPFDKRSTGIAVAFIVISGVGAIWGSCVHQNKKHGFYDKK